MCVCGGGGGTQRLRREWVRTRRAGGAGKRGGGTGATMLRNAVIRPRSTMKVMMKKRLRGVCVCAVRLRLLDAVSGARHLLLGAGVLLVFDQLQLSAAGGRRAVHLAVERMPPEQHGSIKRDVPPAWPAQIWRFQKRHLRGQGGGEGHRGCPSPSASRSATTSAARLSRR